MSNSRKHFGQLVGLIFALIGLSWPTPGQNNPPGSPTWISSGPGTSTYSVAIDPGNPNTVYAGGAGKVFKSNDGGTTWDSLPLGGDATIALAIDKTNPRIVYAGIAFTNFCHHSLRRLFKSVDGGASWSDGVSPPINGCDNIHALVIDPVSSSTLYVANFDDVFGDTWAPLIKSTDGGANWSPPSYTAPFAALVINPQDPKTVYGGVFDFTWHIFNTQFGVLKSTDGGVSWDSTGLADTGVEALVIDPTNPNILYAATRGFFTAPRGFRGLFKSTDAGASWSVINNGLAHLIGSDSSGRGLLPPARASLVIDPDNPTTLYAGFPGSGVFKSVDGGANWSPLNDGLTNLDIRALALAPGNPTTLYAATAGGVFKIVGDTPTTNLIDDAQFFVRQQYRDFLNRSADDPGLAFWTNEITSCGFDDHCIEIKRINVSAAFFLSIEFQETGYLVYRMYKAAYGDLQGTPVPLTRQEFLPDTQRVGEGVVVGRSGWEQHLENNKNAFANEFVARSRFTAAFPQGMTSEQFVDALNANAGSPLSHVQRNRLVSELASGSRTRAQVLRSVAENADLARAEFNKAFVLMQYFGYLRRNPNDPPDLNFSGFDFWLNKLNQFNGNFVQAEMVKAFLMSIEYRQRFGQP